MLRHKSLSPNITLIFVSLSILLELSIFSLFLNLYRIGFILLEHRRTGLINSSNISLQKNLKDWDSFSRDDRFNSLYISFFCQNNRRLSLLYTILKTIWNYGDNRVIRFFEWNFPRRDKNMLVDSTLIDVTIGVQDKLINGNPFLKPYWLLWARLFMTFFFFSDLWLRGINLIYWVVFTIRDKPTFYRSRSILARWSFWLCHW